MAMLADGAQQARMGAITMSMRARTWRAEEDVCDRVPRKAVL
jgi:hypothetical protein